MTINRYKLGDDKTKKRKLQQKKKNRRYKEEPNGNFRAQKYSI